MMNLTRFVFTRLRKRSIQTKLRLRVLPRLMNCLVMSSNHSQLNLQHRLELGNNSNVWLWIRLSTTLSPIFRLLKTQTWIFGMFLMLLREKKDHLLILGAEKLNVLTIRFIYTPNVVKTMLQQFVLARILRMLKLNLAWLVNSLAFYHT